MYQAILFNPGGDFVTDFRWKDTKDEVWGCINDMGSKWFFYPIAFVATDKTIVDIPDHLEALKGKRIETVQKFFRAEWEECADQICADLNAGLPLHAVYGL